MSRGRRLWLVLLAALWLLPAARAHEMSMAEMSVWQLSATDFRWHWLAGAKGPVGEQLRPHWPPGCRDDGQMLRCGPGGLSGRLWVEGVGQRYSAAMVRIHWQEGVSRVYTLTAAQPGVQLHGAAEDRRGLGEIARAYAGLGLEHIFGGIDHLLFVVSLLFLVGFRRRLVWTITAFTLAHSLTLALSALGWLTLRSPPVEATIALSIMLVAGEALHQRPTLSRRCPALVALLFGLVHGLGFAGALKEIGLPQQHLSMALLSFNLGVEAGQLLVVGLLGLAWRFAQRWPSLLLQARAPALYAIGAVAAYWSIGRVAAVLGAA